LCQQNETGIFAPEALTRPKAGPTQAGLSRSQRQRNLAGAFAVPQDQRHRIANRPVLLVDDVMTTGATLYEAARTLQKAGSGPVRGLVLARVLRHGL
jgi:predicted amidophosphoribosyltransferase